MSVSARRNTSNHSASIKELCAECVHLVPRSCRRYLTWQASRDTENAGRAYAGESPRYTHSACSSRTKPSQLRQAGWVPEIEHENRSVTQLPHYISKHCCTPAAVTPLSMYIQGQWRRQLVKLWDQIALRSFIQAHSLKTWTHDPCITLIVTGKSICIVRNQPSISANIPQPRRPGDCSPSAPNLDRCCARLALQSWLTGK